MTEQEIERCLERLSSCKTTDVINFDYAGTHAYIKRLQEENAALRERFLPCKVGDYVYDIANGTAYKTRVLEWRIFDNGHIACRTISSFPSLEEFGTRIFLKKEAAEARLTELKGGENG